jgi:hypothetical protein
MEGWIALHREGTDNEQQVLLELKIEGREGRGNEKGKGKYGR